MRTLVLISLLAAVVIAGELRLGKPLKAAKPVSIEQLNAAPEQYIGKTVQVKGKITEVCQMMGCWMQVVDPASGKGVRVKVNDGDIVFPKDAAGRLATAEGTWTKIELTKEQALARAKHEAEEQGKTFDPAKTGPSVLYQIQGTGAVLETP